jgi:hypothetical protein
VSLLSTRHRAAAFSMTGALVVGTLVGAGAVSVADAATAQSNYDCGPLLGTVPITTVLELPPKVSAGENVPGVPVSMGLPLSGALVSPVSSVAGSVSNVGFLVGSTPSVPITVPTLTALPVSPVDGVLNLLATVTSNSFTAPTTPGQYPVTPPSSFDFLPVGVPGVTSVTCTLTGASSALGFLNVLAAGTTPPPTTEPPTTQPATKAASRTTLALRNPPVTRHKHARILVKVRTLGHAAHGKVVARQGTHVLRRARLNTHGNVLVRLPLLHKPGRHRVVVKYLGNAHTKVSTRAIVLRVRRG